MIRPAPMTDNELPTSVVIAMASRIPVIPGWLGIVSIW